MLLRIIRSFIFIIISIAILGGGFFAGIYSYDYYWQWKNNKDLRNLVNSYEQARKDEEARKMADTFGGKTPQETLQMFIDAVEAGDYELASKYFVEGKREEWKGELLLTNRNNSIEDFLESVKESLNDLKEIYSGTYIANNPVYIEVILYPNGIWKLTEI